MRTNHTLLKQAALVLLLLAVVSGCKKTRIDNDDWLSPSPLPTTDRTLLTRDSIYLYALQTYYWNTSLPSYDGFMPRQYASNDDELFALTKFSLNPATGRNYEYAGEGVNYPKYSFIDDGSVASELGGSGGDFGFSVFYASDNDLRIKYVYPGSPGDVAGMKRGYQIIKINGRTDLNHTDEANLNFVIAAIDKTRTSIDLTIKKPGGSTADVTIAKGAYTINPVLCSNVYTIGTKKVGYLVFNSFTTNATAGLTQLIASFAAQNVNELIVDLRYNGGGSIETSELLCNLIAPASANGSTMYDTYYNNAMQNGKAIILKNQKFMENNIQHSYYDFDFSVAANNTKFKKSGNLNVSRVYFIVTGSTASASELLINNLKPVVDVKLIGTRTYGKPVGFFPIRIDKSDLYIPQFETKNQQGNGGYYQGIPVDKEDVDDVTHDFGDTSEKLLSYALTYADKGVFSAANPKNEKINAAPSHTLSIRDAEDLTKRLDRGEFKGMVDLEKKFNRNTQ
jgi:hypothetical protein